MPYKWDRWIDLVTRVMLVQRTDSEDTFRWNLTNSGSFTVKSMYLDLLNDHTMYLKKYIWKIKVPLKIRIFMWFLHKGVILTKDNLIKRNWHGCTKCCFCDQEETIQHLFISCPFARILWRIIRITFNIYPPANITNLFGNWLNGVAKKDKGLIRVGVCALLWRYGMFAMILSLIKRVFHHFCRLSLWLRIGSICGPFSSLPWTARTWILGATVWRR
jgi:hypothetical protein